MPTRRTKKSAKVVPGGAESASSARRRRRGARHQHREAQALRLDAERLVAEHFGAG